MTNPRILPTERGLIKAALRRVFARSKLHLDAENAARVPGYSNPKQPRCKKWSLCPLCKRIVPTWKTEVDHYPEPVVPLESSLKELTFEELIDRLWCVPENLRSICISCHERETEIQKQQRKKLKAAKKL